jgi:hypothetical protein
MSPVGTLTRYRALTATLWLGWGEREGRGVGKGYVLAYREEEQARIGPYGQETQLGVLGTPSAAIYTVEIVQYHHDIMGYKLP